MKVIHGCLVVILCNQRDWVVVILGYHGDSFSGDSFSSPLSVLLPLALSPLSDQPAFALSPPLLSPLLVLAPSGGEGPPLLSEYGS